MAEDTSDKNRALDSSTGSDVDNMGLQKILHVDNMFENWFLDYASYVNLDRAVPHISDGFKPVQRRVLHSMKELDDGRYIKVATIVGNTMKYHPHGDAAIGDALVNIGQKELLIDCQGNWGNILTGDRAAASRYIEARLSKFALDVVFNPKITQWKLSYDGRNKEPLCLPVKFPLLLAQGTNGIGVGLQSFILPHNFNELIDASIDYLQGKDFVLYPDFLTGGLIDVNNYRGGARGGKITARVRIEQNDKKELVITEIPFCITTVDLIENLEKMKNAGKVPIKKILDHTSDKVEIVLQLENNVSIDQTIDALYAFTDCQISIATNACVIENNKPVFVDVNYILKANAENTKELLRQELEICLQELNDQWHWISLEKLFFEKQIYKELELDQDSFEAQIACIERDFDPYRSMFKKEITHEDVLKLTEKPVRKISKFDIKQAEEEIADIESQIAAITDHLNHLTEYTISYFKEIKRKYGKGRERRTEIRNFDTISVPAAAIANQKLYADMEKGFIGTGLKKNEYICECSDVDEIIIFRSNGNFMITKVCDKKFVGEDIIHISVFKRGDDRTIYNVIYSHGKNGTAYAKRFAIGGITRDKSYDLTQGEPGSKILHFSANANGEAETVKIVLKPKPKLKKTNFEYDFSELAIKGRSSMGNIVSRNPIKSITLCRKGCSTLGDREVWFDDSNNKINFDKRGYKLGDFSPNDKIIAFYQSGYYKITGFDSNVHFDDELVGIEKLEPNKPVTVVYYDNEKKKYFIKRFLPDITDKRVDFVSKEQNQVFELLSTHYLPQIEVCYYIKDKKDKHTQIIAPHEYVEIMKLKSKGKRIAIDNILSFSEAEPLPYEAPVVEEPEDEPIYEEAETAEGPTLDNFPNTWVATDDNNDDDNDGGGVQMTLDI